MPDTYLVLNNVRENELIITILKKKIFFYFTISTSPPNA